MSTSPGNGTLRWASAYQRSQRRRNGLGNWRLVRYADDFVLLVSGDRHHAEALRDQVSAVIAPLGLRLAPEKTRVVHIDEGFDFLGFHIRRMRKRGTNKHYVYTTPSRKSVQKARNRVRETTRLIQARRVDLRVPALTCGDVKPYGCPE